MAVPAAAALAWIVAPVVDLAIRGTIDSRTRAAWRDEARRVADPEPPTVPAPRTPPEQAPAPVEPASGTPAVPA